jgi:hypothetical protein
MSKSENRKKYNLIHIISTIWFAISAGCLWMMAMREAGFHWWVIFSLSGYSLLLVFLLISLYLFAVFRGVARDQKSDIEHPLSTSVYYTYFYDISPFLGAVAGLIASFGLKNIDQYLVLLCAGTFWGTFIVWIIIDPLVGLLEIFLPASRVHRHQRLELAKFVREKRLMEKQKMLEDIQAEEQAQLQNRRNILEPLAEKLADMMLKGKTTDNNHLAMEAVDIGANAWRNGGISYMRQLHSMAIQKFRNKYSDSPIDFISVWWDGVGTWRANFFN